MYLQDARLARLYKEIENIVLSYNEDHATSNLYNHCVQAVGVLFNLVVPCTKSYINSNKCLKNKLDVYIKKILESVNL